MSRIFDALRKSEKRLEEKSFVSPQIFLDTMEKAHSTLPQVPIERARLRPEHRVFAYSDPHSLGAERFRLLRTRLGHLQAARKIKTLLLTSALPHDGKTLMALNLATALAGQSGRSVLLLEGDLRRASILPLLGLKPWSGLSQCLAEGTDPLSAVRRLEPLGFFLLPAGQSPPNPVELLQSQRFSQLMNNLAAYFDWVLIDSPPVTLLADTLVLKARADATLMVVRAGVTPREAVEEAVEELGADHLIGLVLNCADGFDRSYYQYYHYASRTAAGTPSAGKAEEGK